MKSFSFHSLLLLHFFDIYANLFKLCIFGDSRMVYCEKCGTLDIDKESFFCPSCGYDLPQSNYDPLSIKDLSDFFNLSSLVESARKFSTDFQSQFVSYRESFKRFFLGMAYPANSIQYNGKAEYCVKKRKN